jgi:hypothetical protein
MQRIKRNSPSNPGANGTAEIYDEVYLSSTEATQKGRVRFTLFADQAVAIKVEWSDTNTGALRQAGNTAATTASVLYDAGDGKGIRLRPGRNRITAITTTAPTVWQIAIETVDDAVSDA